MVGMFANWRKIHLKCIITTFIQTYFQPTFQSPNFKNKYVLKRKKQGQSVVVVGF